ncbi:aldose 1-epimerase [Trichophyton equinum CBS 127.97]|uniref:Aldose 1-epimerase n=1 Tax=Trichophyton equinum (strain ATCC MYA-4606 / CBS 127.97) TaxID=559882 RepID=F2PXA4_TRIEC|nr:aldose 1-epimerase [Trichophyton equinum CBS 127.97]
MPSNGTTMNGSSSCPLVNGASSNPLQVYTIAANNITASFIPYGARLISLMVPDREGKMQDVIVGYDDPQDYVKDTLTNHTYFGCIVGRYANRIRNGTFVLDGTTYNTPKNELNKTQTLHGGSVGYDQRNWTVTALSNSSITFTLFDSGYEHFPGDVINHVTFSVSSSYGLKGSNPQAEKDTHHVVTSYILGNLDAFKNETVLEDTLLQLPLSSRYVEVDSRLIPTGHIGNVSSSPNGTLDFTKEKFIGKDIKSADGICGANCTGYDNCFIIDRPNNVSDWTSSPQTMAPAVNMSSVATGINMLVTTNQQAIQIYSCNGQNGTIPVKGSQVARNKASGDGNGTVVDKIEQYGCLVIETEGWIDGINNPDWGQDPFQIFSPESGPAINWATYVFSAS